MATFLPRVCEPIPRPGTATVEDVTRLRREYLHAGVELLWMVDHRTRTVTVFRSAQDATVYADDDIIDGGNVLPGWQVNIGELFSFED
ncbi:Uma2 family endonuclease [Pirellulaceae bacterium SH449]